ncbi:MAG TPA: hypothetical protein VIG24_18555, partial [Acidimicrobiia bacterium]
GSWYIWRFEKVSDVLEAGLMDAFREAKQFAEGVMQGEHKADHAKAAAATEANPTTPAGKDDDEVPF